MLLLLYTVTLKLIDQRPKARVVTDRIARNVLLGQTLVKYHPDGRKHSCAKKRAIINHNAGIKPPHMTS
jgi:hypothetical protein